MQLSIQTDSLLLSNRLTSLVEKARLLDTDISGTDKYIFFRSKHDLIEALYWCSLTASNVPVGLWVTQADQSLSGEKEYIIATGNTQRNKKHETTFHFDDNLFIYND